MKMIKLLLTDNVDNLGIVGDVVSVRPGYARNFLLPRELATTPTAGAIKRLAARRVLVEKEMAERRVKLDALFAKLKGYELTLQRSANEQGVLFGGVSQHDIGESMRAEGFEIDDRAVRVGQQIKRLDSYMIPIVLASDLKTEIKLWVVSDKPVEQLETEAAEQAQAKGKRRDQDQDEEEDAAAEPQAEAAPADQAPADKDKSKSRKSGKAKADKAEKSAKGGKAKKTEADDSAEAKA
jgi:large subunit ribosomal protein L9